MLDKIVWKKASWLGPVTLPVAGDEPVGSWDIVKVGSPEALRNLSFALRLLRQSKKESDHY